MMTAGSDDDVPAFALSLKRRPPWLTMPPLPSVALLLNRSSAPGSL